MSDTTLIKTPAPTVYRRFWNYYPVSQRFSDTPSEYPKTRPTFQKILNKKTGLEEVVANGVTQSYAATQEAEKESLLYTVLDRFVRGESDLSEIRQREASFVNLVGAPQNLMEAMNATVLAKSTFEALPFDVRSKFDNNVSNWLKDLDARGRRQNIVAPKSEPTPEPTPSGGES